MYRMAGKFPYSYLTCHVDLCVHLAHGNLKLMCGNTVLRSYVLAGIVEESYRLGFEVVSPDILKLTVER
jgi:hypothetical protein